MDNVTLYYEICANRFLAWVEGECWHEFKYKKGTIEFECVHCGLNTGLPELHSNPDYLHDANAMLRVITAAKKKLQWWKLDGLGQGDYLKEILDFSNGVGEFNLSVLQWAQQTPLYEEWKATL